jgi:CheY-like chemotaxis protein
MGTRGKILIVDDDPIVLRITQARLEGAGFEVVTRQEALGTSQVVLRERPDLVLLDMKMPGLDGDKIAQLLRQREELRTTPIVFHSSGDLISLQEKGREAGALGVIAKTDNDTIFLAQFERLFDHVRSEERVA